MTDEQLDFFTSVRDRWQTMTPKERTGEAVLLFSLACKMEGGMEYIYSLPPLPDGRKAKRKRNSGDKGSLK